jgi:hypothetical protein
MKRSEKQANLASFIEGMSYNFAASPGKSEVPASAADESMLSDDGKPQRILATALQRSGLPVGGHSSNTSAIAHALGVPTGDLPAEIKAACDALVRVEQYGRYPAERRRRSAPALKRLAAALRTTRIRKSYEFSGKFTAEARARNAGA